MRSAEDHLTRAEEHLALGHYDLVVVSCHHRVVLLKIGITFIVAMLQLRRAT